MKAKKVHYPDELKKLIVTSYKKGRSVKCLSCEYGISGATIYRWINKFIGLKILR